MEIKSSWTNYSIIRQEIEYSTIGKSSLIPKPELVWGGFHVIYAGLWIHNQNELLLIKYPTCQAPSTSPLTKCDDIEMFIPSSQHPDKIGHTGQ